MRRSREVKTWELWESEAMWEFENGDFTIDVLKMILPLCESWDKFCELGNLDLQTVL